LISGHLQMHKAHVAMTNTDNTRQTNEIPIQMKFPGTSRGGS
jgi:hypothetical protein